MGHVIKGEARAQYFLSWQTVLCACHCFDDYTALHARELIYEAALRAHPSQIARPLFQQSLTTPREKCRENLVVLKWLKGCMRVLQFRRMELTLAAGSSVCTSVKNNDRIP